MQFIYEIKKLDKKLEKAENLVEVLKEYKKGDYEMLLLQLNENTARLQTTQFISTLFDNQNNPKFAELFDNTLLEIAKENSGLFSVLTEGGEKIVLFENISKYVTDKRDFDELEADLVELDDNARLDFNNKPKVSLLKEDKRNLL